MEGWSELVPDLLIEIENRLLLYVDKVRFRSVCMSWKSIPPNLKFPNDFNFPCLLHPLTPNKDIYMPDSESEESESDRSESEEESESDRSESEEESEAAEEGEGASYGLFSPDEKRVYHLDMLNTKGVIFKGSSYCWVVTIPDTITRTGPDIYLLNPLTNARIQLPPRNKFPDILGYRHGHICPKRDIKAECKVSSDGDNYYIPSYNVNVFLLYKVVLSSNPLSQDCVAIAIYGEQSSLAYCKCNDTDWKCLSQRTGFRDVIFHTGKLHAVDTNELVLVFENIGEDPKFTQIASARVLVQAYTLWWSLVPGN